MKKVTLAKLLGVTLAIISADGFLLLSGGDCKALPPVVKGHVCRHPSMPLLTSISSTYPAPLKFHPKSPDLEKFNVLAKIRNHQRFRIPSNLLKKQKYFIRLHKNSKKTLSWPAAKVKPPMPTVVPRRAIVTTCAALMRRPGPAGDRGGMRPPSVPPSMALLRRAAPGAPPGGGQGNTARWFCLPRTLQKMRGNRNASKSLNFIFILRNKKIIGDTPPRWFWASIHKGRWVKLAKIGTMLVQSLPLIHLIFCPTSSCRPDTLLTAHAQEISKRNLHRRWRGDGARGGSWAPVHRGPRAQRGLLLFGRGRFLSGKWRARKDLEQTAELKWRDSWTVHLWRNSPKSDFKILCSRKCSGKHLWCWFQARLSSHQTSKCQVSKLRSCTSWQRMHTQNQSRSF